MNILSGNFDKFYVDCMANSVDKFYSKYSSPGTFGVKFFRSDSLSEGFLFLFLFVKLSMTFFILKKFKVSGILVIFVYPRSQIFYLFFPDGVHASFWVFSLDLINPSFISSVSRVLFQRIANFQHRCFRIYFSE